jgi:glycosyltransferase involved in cell wall biosynthesis
MLSYANGYIVSPVHDSPSNTVSPVCPCLALIVPCYNEEEIIAESVAILCAHLDAMVQSGLISDKSFICCIDDGSNDETFRRLNALAETCPRLAVLSLGANVGHQRALLAGLMHVRGQVDCCVSIDADLQDDVTAIGRMLDAWRSGNHVVLGVRESRKSDSIFKRGSAQAFYSMQQMLGVRAVPDHADFRLLSATALDALAAFGERNLFLRGVVMDMGLPVSVVFYARQARTGGETKYTIGRMLNLALDGITSFTSRPLRLLFFAGLIILLASMFAMAYVVWQVLIGGEVVQGWASLVVLVLFLGGGQLMALGIVGEYIGRIYIETKHRPLGVIRSIRAAQVSKGIDGGSRNC